MLKLRINPIVAKDLKNIRDYIAEDNEGEISGEAVFIGWDKNRGGRQQIHNCMGPPPFLCQARVCVISFAESHVWPPRQYALASNQMIPAVLLEHPNDQIYLPHR